MSIKVDGEVATPNEDIKLDTDRAFWTKYEGLPDVTQFAQFNQDGTVQYTTLQDPSDVLSTNQALRQESDENWRANETFKLAGRVPIALWLEWERLGITSDSKALIAALKRHRECLVTTKTL
jgi:hypothetical protein